MKNISFFILSDKMIDERNNMFGQIINEDFWDCNKRLITHLFDEGLTYEIALPWTVKKQCYYKS